MLERWLALATERRSYRPDHLRLLAAVSSQVGEELRNAYPGVPIRETPNGVDLDRFRPDLRAREVVRRALKVDERTLVVIFVGGDWHRKGLSVAIEAAAAGLVGDMPWELWVVGAGDERRFARQAAAVGLRGAVRFLGPLGDVERYYQAADIYLCCSEYEALSLALLEAAASGLPIVTTPVGGVAELRAESGDDGGVLVRSSLHEIGSALSKLSADPARRAAYGQAARRRAEHFGWEPLANQIDALYQELLQDRTIGRSGIPLAPVRRQHGE